MSTEFMPPAQLGESQRAAFALAGTVALPSPFPASGLISIGVFPPPADAKEHEPTYYLRIVERVSDSNIVTRHIRPEDVRAFRVRSKVEPYPEQNEWTLHLAADKFKFIDSLKKKLQENLLKGGPTEIALFDHAPTIVYVPDGAPVLLRIEMSVTASRARDGASAVGCNPCSGCCHADGPPIFNQES
jgi:hypothetical protein